MANTYQDFPLPGVCDHAFLWFCEGDDEVRFEMLVKANVDSTEAPTLYQIVNIGPNDAKALFNDQVYPLAAQTSVFAASSASVKVATWGDLKAAGIVLLHYNKTAHNPNSPHT